jgi:hypothetical protein
MPGSSSSENRQTIDRFDILESRVPKNDFVRHLHAARFVNLTLRRRSAIVKRNHAAGLDQTAPRIPVSQQTGFSVVAINEQEIDRMMIAGGLDAVHLQPSDAPTGYTAHYVMRDAFLKAQPEPSGRVRIDGGQLTAGIHDFP